MFFLLILRERFDFLPPTDGVGAGCGATAPEPFDVVAVAICPAPYDCVGGGCGI